MRRGRRAPSQRAPVLRAQGHAAGAGPCALAAAAAAAPPRSRPPRQRRCPRRPGSAARSLQPFRGQELVVRGAGRSRGENASNGLWTHQNDEKLGFLRGHGFSVAWWRTLLSSSTLRHRATRCVGGPHAGRNLPPPPAKCTPVGPNALLSGPICRESTKIQNFSTPPPGAARCGAGSGVLGVAAIRPAAAAYVDT